MPHQVSHKEWDLPEVPVTNTGKEIITESSKLKQEDLQDLLDFVKSKKLPRTCDADVVKFLHTCDYDVEKAKKRLKAYSYGRQREMFNDWDVKLPNIQSILREINVVLVPRRTPENYRLIIISPTTTDATNFIFLDLARVLCMIIETIILTEPSLDGILTIYDLKNVGFRHFFKVSLTVLRQYRDYIQEGIPLKMRDTHLTNCSGLIDKGLRMVRSIGSKEDWDKVHTHRGDDLSELHRLIPQDCLPSDYGGTLPSLLELKDFTVQRLDNFKEILGERLAM